MPPVGRTNGGIRNYQEEDPIPGSNNKERILENLASAQIEFKEN